MSLRPILAGTALALSLAGCSGASEDAAEAPTTEASVSPAAAPTTTGPEATPAADASATPSAAASAEAAPEPTPTPSATGTTAAARPAPAPAPTPEKVAAAVAAPPASWARCAICHDASKGGADKLGPNLWGTYGAKAAQGSFAFSDALKASGLTWTDANLDKWLENPRALVPGNRMSFPGLKDAAKRQEIIAYLKQQR